MLQHTSETSSMGQAIPFCVEQLILHLQSANGAERLKAREALIKIGRPAVLFITPLLNHRDELIRWEACKTLEHIRDPHTASLLAEMLIDEDMDVRWVAADALIELEEHAIIPVLEMIEKYFDSPVLREAARHVLHALKELQLLDASTDDVLRALKITELPSKAAFTASRALDYLRTHQPQHRHHVLS